MKKNYYKRRTCRLCTSKKLIPVLTLTSCPMADEYIPLQRTRIAQPTYPLVLMLCKNCGQMQIQDVVYPENIYKEYLYKTVSSLGLSEHFRIYTNDLIQQIKPPTNSLIVDVGSNDGTLLKYFKKLGFRILGVDPAKDIARQATKSGINTIPNFFIPTVATQIKKTYGFASIITANNLYANIDNLDEFTLAIKKLLSPDGVFVFESFYVSDLIDHMVFDFIYHEHLSYFSVKPLNIFFRKHNMELIHVSPVSTKGGSLRYTVQLIGGPRKVSPSVVSFIQREDKKRLHSKKTFTLFAKRIEVAKKNIQRILTTLKKQKKTIAGFGASASTTTLLYHFNLTKSIDYLIDEYSLKQNTYSPGVHIPVLSPPAIYKKNPDYIFLCAWRYWEPITKKNRKYLRQGGHFIVPLPKLRMI